MALPMFAIMLAMRNYDKASAMSYQLKTGGSLTNSRGHSHRIPSGENEGLILRPAWHPEFKVGIQHDIKSGRGVYLHAKTGRYYSTAPSSQPKGTERVY